MLAQGAASHYLDCLVGHESASRRGVKDLDVWMFYAAMPGTAFPAARRETHADFGPSTLGRQSYDLAGARTARERALWRRWNNLVTAERPAPTGEHVGLFGLGGESAAHRMLKLYVAGHPLEFGLSAAAVPHVEYSFATGDRVDVMFENHLADRTVVEVEVEGDQQLCIGVHQAIKYRSLAAADAGFPLLTSRVRSVVVAYTVDCPMARELAERYDIPLLEADRETVLAGAR